MEESIREFLMEKRGYLKKSPQIILERLGLYPVSGVEIIKREAICRNIKKAVRRELKEENKKVKVDYGKIAPNHNAKKRKKSKAYKGDPNNVLVIGDLHEPFCLEGYLDHCKQIQIKENCGTVVFIGDIIDNHYSSYHEQDPDGFGAGEELDRAIAKIENWYDAFPEATVIIGNHDRLVYRKAFSGGVSKRWIREYHEVLNTPGWEFLEAIVINGVNYNHGEGGTARTRMKNEMQSQVQGHHHNQFYIDYNVSPVCRIFGVQVGCGVDRKQYAMAYGKHFKKPVIGCGTIIGKNPVPRIHPMLLED